MNIVFAKSARALLLLPCVMVVAATAPSRGEILYPYCKVGGGDVGTGVGSCNYTSLEQCKLSSAGYGMCFANPAYMPPAAATAQQRRAKRS